MHLFYVNIIKINEHKLFFFVVYIFNKVSVIFMSFSTCSVSDIGIGKVSYSSLVHKKNPL